jgi:hypothetical protein
VVEAKLLLELLMRLLALSEQIHARAIVQLGSGDDEPIPIFQ